MKPFLRAFLILSVTMLAACGEGPNPWESKTEPAANAATPASTPAQQWLAGQPAAPAAAPATPVIPAPSTSVAPVTPALNGQKVKVALLVPLSGNAEPVGEALQNAAQLALFDVGGETFQLMPHDTQGTAAGARAAAQAAVQEGAQIILGPLFAEEVRAVTPVAQAANINVIAFTTDWKQASPHTFVMGFLPFGQVQRVVQFAAARHLRNIGVIATQSDYGDAVVNAYKTYAAQAGINTVGILQVRAGDAAMPTQIERFTNYDRRRQPNGTLSPSPFDAVFLPIGGREASSVAALLNSYGLTPSTARRLGTGLWDDDAMARDPNLNGGWFAAPDPRARKVFEGKYYSAYGVTPPRIASLGYDATALTAVLAKAGIQSHGAPSFDRAAITNPNGFSGIDGIFRFRNDGLAERGLAILELHNGQTVVIDPASRTFQSQ